MRLTKEDLVAAVRAKRQVEDDPNRPETSEACWDAVGKLLGINGPAARNRCAQCGETLFRPLPGRPAPKPGRSWRSNNRLFFNNKK
jgi:hypothetical protein